MRPRCTHQTPPRISGHGRYRRTLVTAAIEAASNEGLADDPLEWFAL
jgi:hypothetical protein